MNAYRPIAPLLHLAAFGFIIDWPARVNMVMLRREMDFRRLKILLGCNLVVQLAVALGVGWAGGGAYAIVLGSNVVGEVPFSVDLLLVRRWRPGRCWWRWPDWVAYRPALRFGFQQAGSGLLVAARGAVEATVLARLLGYTPIGLLNRARGLLTGTVGRAGSALIETAYPLLPRYASDRKRYADQATLFVQVVLLVVIPATLYVGVDGTALLRLLYGDKWLAADPLIWPAALGAMGLAMFRAGAVLVLAVGRVHTYVVLEVSATVCCLLALGFAWSGYGIIGYAWGVAGSLILTGAVSLASASSLLVRGWTWSALCPPTLGGLFSVAVVMGVDLIWPTTAVFPRLCVDTCVFALALVFVLRCFFPRALATLLSRAPGGDRVSDWLLLRAVFVR
jgi:PST family polysaccharide transporter